MSNKPEYPLTEFQTYLKGQVLGESSIRQTVTAIRRALKSIGPDDLTDPQMLAYYRASLTETSRNVFGCAWHKFVAYTTQQGITLPEHSFTPKTRFVHPLWADVTELAMYLPLHSIPAMRWTDERLTRVPESVIEAAARAFTFVTDRRPTIDDTLIPKRIDSQDGLPGWALEAILRSDARATGGNAERFWQFTLQHATRRGASAKQLQELFLTLWEHRHRLKARSEVLRTIQQEIELESGLLWSASHERIEKLCGGFVPVAPTIYW